mmetsp:Transcript_9515/g.28985  ORF Transcript_9515/g.28985 Transcript_9515/m.28985 type:complete len:121 (-) Transcript_9515:153-515(-)
MTAQPMCTICGARAIRRRRSSTSPHAHTSASSTRLESATHTHKYQANRADGETASSPAMRCACQEFVDDAMPLLVSDGGKTVERGRVGQPRPVRLLVQPRCVVQDGGVAHGTQAAGNGQD